MGMPVAQTQALRALLQTALRAYANQPQAAGSSQCLQALDAALQAAQGHGLGTLTPLLVPSGETPWHQILAGALKQLPENETALVGNDFAQSVFALNQGVRAVELQPGIKVAQSIILEVDAQTQNPAEVQAQARAGQFGPHTAIRLFVQRTQIPRMASRAPAWTAGALKNLAEWMPHGLVGLRLTLETWALRLNPLAVWQGMLAGLPLTLQTGWLGRELAGLNINSQEPLAVAYRTLVYNPAPSSRAEFAKVLLRMIRQQQSDRFSRGEAEPAAQNALDWMAFSEVFRGLGAMPLAEVARVDTGNPAVAAWPRELTARTLVIPVALIEAKRGRGALGYLTGNLEKGPFNVDTDLIRLFLRKGIQRFAGAA